MVVRLSVPSVFDTTQVYWPVCVYVYLSKCMFVFMYLCVYVCLHVFLCVFACFCMCARMFLYVCLHVLLINSTLVFRRALPNDQETPILRHVVVCVVTSS